MSEEKPTEKKTKTKAKESKPATSTFPAKTFINKWGFIHLSQKVTEAFGTTKGEKTPITINLQEGALIIKKA